MQTSNLSPDVDSAIISDEELEEAMAEHFSFRRVKAKRMHPRYRVVVCEDLIIYRFTKRQPKGKAASTATMCAADVSNNGDGSGGSGGDGSDGDDGDGDGGGGAVAANAAAITTSAQSTSAQPQILLLTNGDATTTSDPHIAEKT